MTNLILIGGVPGTGKTTIAYELALRLKIDKVISTDLVKAFSISYETNKYLFTTTHEAYKLDNISIIDGYLKHSYVVNSMLLKLLNNIKDKTIIVEGCTINNDFINMLDKDKYNVIYCNLFLPTADLIKRYELKSKLRKSNWIDNIKVIEEINNYLANSNTIINDDKKNTIERMINYVKTNLCI